MRAILAMVAMASIAGPVWAQRVRSESRPMEFEACLQFIRAIATELAVAPTNVVETNILRVVRFPTADGSILVSCSRTDNKLIVTASPHR